MFCVGAHRYVFVMGPFVAKVPRIMIGHYIRYLKDDIIFRKRFWFRWHWFVEVVCAGFMENFREVRRYRNTKHHLLARLYIPLVLVNIYHRESGVGSFAFGGDELFEMVRETGDREYMNALVPCSHTFDHPENFAFSNGCVKILDYGERGFENLLTNHGIKVEQLLLSVAKTSS